MTAGERRFAERLEQKLEEDYCLWYDVPIGHKRLHPDFIILHPQRGVIILEVKDWKLETIQSINPESATLLTPEGTKTTTNPLKQARQNALAVVKMLGRDSLLLHTDGLHCGKPVFTYSYGVVLTNITRKQFNAQRLPDILEPHLVICQDEFYESVDPMEFQQRLWNLCTYNFGDTLTPTQIDRIRWLMFPEVRIGEQRSLLPDQPIQTDEDVEIPDIMRVMDLQQEQLARSLGDGHRVVHGVAGSGKTMILVYRCIKLVEQTTKPILVLCFNVALAAKLRVMLHEKGIGSQVEVRNFHKWCSDLLYQYKVSKPSRNQYKGGAYYDEMVQRVIEAVAKGKIPSGCYGAVLIDEGHDFKPEWLKLTTQMVDPDTNSLLLLYDDAQSIFEKQTKRAFSFKSVGIQAQGRTKVLTINYRNTEEILKVASTFAQELLTPTQADDDDTPPTVQPITGGRHGPLPQLIKLPSYRDEVRYMVEQCRKLKAEGLDWKDMAILYRKQGPITYEIVRQFQDEGLPLDWVNRDKQSRNYDSTHNSIKLVTLHSSKGLEFPAVFIGGLGALPLSGMELEDEVRLLYVGMTRALDRLVLTCDRQTEFVERLEKALAAV
jgi:hypothetical protein